MSDLDILSDEEREALNELLRVPTLAPLRALVVDDDPDSRELLAEILALHGIECTTASNASTAFELLMQDRGLGLLITDLRMFPATGLDLIRQLRESERAALPIIIISGDAAVQDAIEAMHLSVVDFLLKPIDANQLLQLVRRELGIS
ncbi:response regulator [Pseudomonas sp. Marseille-Q5115]|uniref:response regulator n=1 Tax=Pseudomonas sp. Marseille-Q5115 TaxID=2866593 RepID=UPI001CE47446|nr:response regulator [Pseudomonas sp. Marseille-Q5115]